jgi:hypothetical protein
MVQASRLEALPPIASPSTALCTPQGITASLEARELEVGKGMMKAVKKGMDVLVFWADADGVQDWWKARVSMLRLCAEGQLQAGIQVEWLNQKGEVHKDSGKHFLSVAEVARKLRLIDELVNSNDTQDANIISRRVDDEQDASHALLSLSTYQGTT